jgi:hypothetical protein
MFVDEVLYARGVPFEEQVMCRHRAPRIIVHGRDGPNFLPVEVSFVLYTECVGTGPYVGEDGALHPPPCLTMLANTIPGGGCL